MSTCRSTPCPCPPTADELTDTERAVLALERGWWKYAGAKHSEVFDQFGWTPTRYYQVLNALIDKPAALAHDPLVVRRLLRLRTARQRQRSAAAPAVQYD